jgi:hypothetical protein
LDKGPLFNAINFAALLDDPYNSPLGGSDGAVSCTINRTVMSIRIDTFLCPSDGVGDQGWTGGSNYRANLGAERGYAPGPDDIGPFSAVYSTTPAMISDGLGNTAAFSEKLKGALHERRIDLRRAAVQGGLGTKSTVEDSIRDCVSKPLEDRRVLSKTGLCWFETSHLQTTYNHVLVPNSSLPDCVNQPETPPGFVAARSNHARGVDVAFIDGSVRFISSDIVPQVWRAIGTRAGGEPTPDAF